jgi:hypothetical protein
MEAKRIAYYNWVNLQWIAAIYGYEIRDEHMLKLVNHIAKGARAWTDRIAGKEWNKDLWSIETKDDLIALENRIRQTLVQSLISD